MAKRIVPLNLQEEITAMRAKGFKDYFCNLYLDGRYEKAEMKHTARGISSFVDRMLGKYGDRAEIQVEYYNPTKNSFDRFTTYGM